MNEGPSPYRKVLFVCGNQRQGGLAACGDRGSLDLVERLKAYVKSHGLKKKVRVARSGCLDLCELGPNVAVYPDNKWYSGVRAEDLETIIREHLRPLEEG
ncbi:MAG: (2Fe-2S) ferredoxin domain-containing protein [Planctomycetes bacterium]|nr:(2Fe-2S) ferredoxin domain-containing protein [Planctomycetota bacterium]